MDSRYVEAEAARVVAERAPHVSEQLALRTYTARLLGAETGARPPRRRQHERQGRRPRPLRRDRRRPLRQGLGLGPRRPSSRPVTPRCAWRRSSELLALDDDDRRGHGGRAAPRAARSRPRRRPASRRCSTRALPARFIDHTHADAILAIADQHDGESICREVFGDALVWVPYVMPGLRAREAPASARGTARSRGGRTPTVIVLERHGIFTFGDTAKESYERMIDAVTTRRARHRRHAWTPSTVAQRRAPDDGLESRVASVRPRRARHASAASRPSARPSSRCARATWILDVPRAARRRRARRSAAAPRPTT